MAKTVASATVLVRCRGCGEPRQLSARQAKRAGLCPRCLYPTNWVVTDQHRNYWFNHYTDWEIAGIASDLVGSWVDPGKIHEQRVLLADAQAHAKAV